MSTTCITFVMSYIVDGKRKPAKSVGIFYALTILLAITAVTPVWSVNAPTAIDWCKTTGKGSRFSCPKMPNNVLQMAALITQGQTMTSLQIAEATGRQHKNVMRDIRNLIKQLEDRAEFNFELGNYQDANGQSRPCYLLTKKDSLLLASGYDANLRAKIINRWEELEMEKQTPVRRITSLKVSDRIRAAKFLASFLNLNESSKLLIAKSIAEPLGLPTPDYTPSKGVLRSCAELLKEHSSDLSAQQFNQRMIQHGYMTQMSRPSSNGGVKKFKSIVADGLQYGENQVNPNNPKSAQPLYYADKFTELLNILTV